MPRPDTEQLRSRLLRAGIAPRHVARTVVELNDHFDDLVDEAMNRGTDRGTAEQDALRQLGEMDYLASAVCERTELRSWASHYPLAAMLVYPLACLAVLPLVPVIAGVTHASLLARWAGCALLSGFFTAALLLVMQLSITLT